jgi:hypothetical protein
MCLVKSHHLMTTQFRRLLCCAALFFVHYSHAEEAAVPDRNAAIEALKADGPLSAYRDKLMLFGQFIGTWDMDIRFYDEKGKQVFKGPGEWMFSWVLDGRAVQDVLTYASTTEPNRTAVGERRIGTTLRYYDPALDSWRMVWLGATSGTFLILNAKAVGSTIAIAGRDMDGSYLRWKFTDLSPDEFHWTGMTSRDRKHWRMEQEMYGRRRGAPTK